MTITDLGNIFLRDYILSYPTYAFSIFFRSGKQPQLFIRLSHSKVQRRARARARTHAHAHRFFPFLSFSPFLAPSRSQWRLRPLLACPRRSLLNRGDSARLGH